jgi:hypothetical protein
MSNLLLLGGGLGRRAGSDVGAKAPVGREAAKAVIAAIPTRSTAAEPTGCSCGG